MFNTNMLSLPLSKAERKKTYNIDWRLKHPDKLKEYAKRRIKKTRDLYQNNPEYRRKRIDSARKFATIKYTKLKKEVIQKLGSKCIYCGCNILEALEINHINGGGSKELGITAKKNGKNKSYLSFFKEILNDKRKDIELVCRVCNSVHWLKLKGIEGFEVKWKNGSIP